MRVEKGERDCGPGEGSTTGKGEREVDRTEASPARGPRVRDLASWLDTVAPPGLAEDWDNVGLLVGDPETEPVWVGVALDAAHALADPRLAAPERGPGLLVTHHPVPFRPVGRLLQTDPTGATLLELARRGWSLYAAHTSFDAAPEGLSHRLALDLGLDPTGLGPLVPAGSFRKLVVFVPATHTEAVRAALAASGAGWIGNYSDAAFASPGRGYFRPREGANPFLGKAGRVEEVSEDRLETIVPAHRLGEAVAAMLAAHPYEEPAYDVYPLASHPPVTRPELAAGVGRVGLLASGETDLEDFRVAVEQALGLPSGRARLLGDTTGLRRPDAAGPSRRGGDPHTGRVVRRVAVCPGAGGSYGRQAAEAGADVFVTGDLSYHQVLEAAQAGLALLDCGHLATEKAFVGLLADRLRKHFASQGIPLDVIEVSPPPGWSL